MQGGFRIGSGDEHRAAWECLYYGEGKAWIVAAIGRQRVSNCSWFCTLCLYYLETDVFQCRRYFLASGTELDNAAKSFLYWPLPMTVLFWADSIMAVMVRAAKRRICFLRDARDS